ncbi:MAG: Gx transporter family protein [Lachnospiraceae bacterium]|nr:Gx transporter family protein [Lachnospiraceae bacterium]
MSTKRIATDGLLLALALILSFIDSMIPMPIPVAGIKLGLANLAVIYGLYRLGAGDAVVISIARVILSGLMFAGMSGILYSLAGAALSLTVMCLMHRFTDYHLIPVSVCGSLAHIAGQLVVAAAMTSIGVITYYAPILLISAFIAGIVIGGLGSALLKVIKE